MEEYFVLDNKYVYLVAKGRNQVGRVNLETYSYKVLAKQEKYSDYSNFYMFKYNNKIKVIASSYNGGTYFMIGDVNTDVGAFVKDVDVKDYTGFNIHTELCGYVDLNDRYKIAILGDKDNHRVNFAFLVDIMESRLYNLELELSYETGKCKVVRLVMLDNNTNAYIKAKLEENIHKFIN